MFANSEINYRSDDETLVNHCLTGDENAFGFLVHKYKDLVHAYAYQKVSNYADAEDITQEVFIRAYRNLAKLKYPHRFRSWLYAIASNECKRWLSKNLLRREKEVNLEDAPEGAFGFEEDFAQSPTDWQIDLQEALQKLPEDNRIAVSMFYMSGCSLKEIGEYLGVSVNTVKGKLHRARQQLGNALCERYGRALSKKKLKGGFIMQVMEQLQQLSRPTMPPSWQGNLLRQIPIALAMAACVLMGILSFFAEEIHYTKMSEVPPFVLVDIRQPSAQASQKPLRAEGEAIPKKLGFYVSDTKKDTQALAEADALLTAKKYRQAIDTYRALIDSTSSDEISFAAYYGLGVSLYKSDWTAGDRTDEAINMLMFIPKENKYWLATQLLLGRCFLRKGIWAKENEEKLEDYETALQAFQTVLDRQTKDDLRKETEYLQKLCQVERGEANPNVPAVRKQLEVALQDEDSAIRFVAADALNMDFPGMRIVGAVTDQLTGQPVASALVSISRMGNGKTDEQGRFSIDNLSGLKGEAILWVEMKGYGKKMAQFMISETEIDTQVDVQLGPGATVIGRVVDSNGQPIVGADVRIIGDYYTIRSVKTDVEGKYQFEGIEVRQDAYRLLVEHPDFIYSPSTISVSQTDIVESTDIVLNRGVTLKGRVTDEAGNPIQGVRVNASGGPAVIGGDTRTEANGEYYLKNLRGNFATVVVDSPQFMPVYKRVRLDAGKELPPVDFVLKPGKTLIGRVVDEQGKPIEGVKLQFQTWEPIEYSWFDHFATTDANGEFRMEHLPDGKITLRLDKEGYLYMNEQPAEIEHDQSITTMKTPIVMQKGARAYGKVVDAETGKPIRNFKVKAEFPKQLEPGDIHPDGIPGDWDSGLVFQSDTGEFKTFERFRGMAIALQVEAEGYAPTYIPRVVLGAYDKEPLIIRMNKQASSKSIVVDAETGKPLAGALITTFDKNHPLFIHGIAPEHRATEPVSTDAQGKFTLPGALAEEFYLYVTHSERAPAIVGPLNAPSDEKPQPIRVEMQKGGVVMGKATPGLEITLILEHELYPMMVQLQTRASHEGIYRFENLTPGKYSMHELIPGEGFASSGRSIQFELESKETRTFNLLRTGSARLYGKVTEADGTPIKNVVVRIMGRPKDIPKPLPPDMQLSPEMKLKMDTEYSGVAITDADGDYEIVGLHPGNYQLQAEVKTFPTSSEIEAARRTGKFPERPKPRRTTSTFALEEGDKEVGLDIVFPEKE